MQAALIACPHRAPWHSHHWHGGTHGSMKRDPIVTGSGTQELSSLTFSPPRTQPAFQSRLDWASSIPRSTSFSVWRQRKRQPLPSQLSELIITQRISDYVNQSQVLP